MANFNFGPGNVLVGNSLGDVVISSPGNGTHRLDLVALRAEAAKLGIPAEDLDIALAELSTAKPGTPDASRGTWSKIAKAVSGTGEAVRTLPGLELVYHLAKNLWSL